MSDEKTDHAIDRADWDPGPWDDEPDKISWRTRAGLPGLIVRNNLGALCGYAAVAPGHPDYGKGYGEVDVDAHGGLTFANKCRGPICHVPEPGEPDDVWWFGFDCGHSGDYMPAQSRFANVLKGTAHDPRLFRPQSWESYKDVAYVTEEVERLAEQLAARAKT